MGIERYRLGSFIRAGAVGLLVVGLVGCGKGQGDPTQPEVHAPAEELEGTWSWVRSVDVNTLDLHTPGADDFQAELVFVADSEREGSYVYRRTGAPEVNGRFGIGSEDSPGNDFIAIDHPIDFLESHAWVVAGTDSLWLGGVFENGYNSLYARVSASPSPDSSLPAQKGL